MLLKQLAFAAVAVLALTTTTGAAADVDCAALTLCETCAGAPGSECAWCADEQQCVDFTAKCPNGQGTSFSCDAGDGNYSFCDDHTVTTRQSCDTCVSVPGNGGHLCAWCVDGDGTGACTRDTGNTKCGVDTFAIAIKSSQCAAPEPVCGSAVKNGDCDACMVDTNNLVTCVYCKSTGKCMNLSSAAVQSDGGLNCPQVDGQPPESVVITPSMCAMDLPVPVDSGSGACMPCLQAHCHEDLVPAMMSGGKDGSLALGTCAVSSCASQCSDEFDAEGVSLSPKIMPCLACYVKHCADVDKQDAHAKSQCVVQNCVAATGGASQNDCLSAFMTPELSAKFEGFPSAYPCLRCMFHQCANYDDESCMRDTCGSSCKPLVVAVATRRKAGELRQREYAAQCLRTPQFCAAGDDDDAGDGDGGSPAAPGTDAARMSAGCCKMLDQPTCASVTDTTSAVLQSDNTLAYSACTWAGPYHECVPASRRCTGGGGSDDDKVSTVGLVVGVIVIVAVIAGSIVACIKCQCQCCRVAGSPPAPQHITSIMTPGSTAPYSLQTPVPAPVATTAGAGTGQLV
jgi:hypothetical protein